MATNQLQSLSEIFNGCYFRIPDYQRGYAWENEQLDDFWSDLISLEDGHVHYTGVLTVENVSDKEKSKSFFENDLGAKKETSRTYYLVDGQQRLTTSIILIDSIVKRAKMLKGEYLSDDSKISTVQEKFISKDLDGGYKAYIFGYTTDNPSYEFFKTKIFGLASTANQNVETLYTFNLENAKNYFDKKLEVLDLEEIKKIFLKLTTQFKFNFYEITGDLDVFVAFETMNNRGKKLSNLELLKNRLIYLSTKCLDDIKEELRTDINNSWKTIYAYLGKNKNEPLDDDEFLKNHWIMYFKYSRKTGSDYIDFLLKEQFTTQNILKNIITTDEIKKYVENLQESVRYWYFLHNPQSSEFTILDNQKIALDRLKRIGFGAFRPLLMSIFVKNQHDNDELLKLLNIMERFIFLVFYISQRKSNTGDSEFYRWAKDYQDGLIKIQDMIGKKEEADKYSGLVWWIISYFNVSSFKTYLEDKFKHQEGYYSWSGLGYFLFEYEQKLLQDSRGNSSKINWLEFLRSKKDFVSIEHVLPQTPTDQYWQNNFANYNDEEIKKLTNTLGNLVPLSVSKNAKLQNFSFDIKKAGKNEDKLIGYINGSLSEIEISQYEKWTYDSIYKRSLKILDFMTDRWGLKEFIDDFSFWQGIEPENILFLPNNKQS